jgi:hypothetical protein
MGNALICDVAAATNPGAAGAAAAPGAGSTFTIRNSALSSNVWLIDLWRKGAAAGFVRLASPKVVPVAGGINVNGAAGLADFLMYGMPFQALTPQDILAVTISGGGAETDVAVMQSYYQDLPGVSMTLKNSGDILGNTQFVFGWRVATVSPVTPGAQALTAITATQDSSTANAWYALLGYVTDASVALVGLSGVDTSASTIGGPGDATTPKNTSSYFQDLANMSGMPMIPCFNAANKGNTFVVTADSGVSTPANVTLVVAEMNSTWNP